MKVDRSLVHSDPQSVRAWAGLARVCDVGATRYDAPPVGSARF